MPPRLRKTLKWTGLALSAALFSFWLASGWINSTWRLTPPANPVFIHFNFGVVEIYHFHEATIDDFSTTYDPGLGGPQRPVWHLKPWFARSFGFRKTGIEIPLWFPLLMIATPTAFLWHKDHRRKLQGKCPNCGYTSQGLPPNSLCPECGKS